MKYRKGSDNPSDYLSRHPNQSITVKDHMAEDYVRFISSHAVPNAMTIAEIELATSKDPTLQKVIELHKSNQWHTIKTIADPEINKDELKIFYFKKQTLTVKGNLLLKNNQIIIAGTLRKKAIDLAHQGHMGITKTKMLIGEKIWFPFIDKYTQEQIEHCLPCQASSKEPMASSTLPPRPWHTLKTDFKGPLPSGEYLLVVYDCYSRFPEVEFVESTSAVAVISKFYRISSTHGIPEKLISDNGPPLQSNEWARYMKSWGIKHVPDTP